MIALTSRYVEKFHQSLVDLLASWFSKECIIRKNIPSFPKESKYNVLLRYLHEGQDIRSLFTTFFLIL